MSAGDCNQPVRAVALLVAAVVSLAGCAKHRVETRVRDLNWACGASRCTASFRLDNEGDEGERLSVVVRAYSGGTVPTRQVAGEHRERVFLDAGQARRLNVTIELRQPADKLRVIVARAPD